MKAFKWVLAGLLLILGIIALVLHKLSKAKMLGRAAVTAIEAAHAPTIAVEKERLATLEKNLANESTAAEESRAKIEQRKHELQLVYSAVGLSTDEVIERLARLKL